MSSRASPYVGPRPFESHHSHLFFGREKEARELLSQAISHRELLLYAQSGAGKSSILNARLIPALEEEEFHVYPIARVVGPLVERAGRAAIRNFYIHNLLCDLVGDHTLAPDLAGMSLAEFLGWEAQRMPRSDSPRAIIIDQFEEFFNYFPAGWARQREEFFGQFAIALQNDLRLRVVISMREDFLAQLDPYARQLPDRLRGRFRLERLREKTALQAVAGPLQGTGVRFDDGVAEQVVQGLLVSHTIDALGNRVVVEGEYVEPVQLQLVCSSLWATLPPGADRITHGHIQEFGDIDRALIAFYEQSVRQVAAQGFVNESELRTWFDEVLITPMHTRGTSVRNAEATGGLSNAVVDLLEQQHLIRSEYRAGARWYELTHDRFIDPILESNRAWRAGRRNLLTQPAEQWKRLGEDEGSLLRGRPLAESRTWAEKHAAELTLLERAFLAASIKAEHEAQRQNVLNRRFRAASVALAFACLVALLTAHLALSAQQREKVERGKAAAARDTAVDAQIEAEGLAMDLQATVTRLDSLARELRFVNDSLARRENSLARAVAAASLARDQALRREREALVEGEAGDHFKRFAGEIVARSLARDSVHDLVTSELIRADSLLKRASALNATAHQQAEDRLRAIETILCGELLRSQASRESESRDRMRLLLEKELGLPLCVRFPAM